MFNKICSLLWLNNIISILKHFFAVIQLCLKWLVQEPEFMKTIIKYEKESICFIGSPFKCQLYLCHSFNISLVNIHKVRRTIGTKFCHQSSQIYLEVHHQNHVIWIEEDVDMSIMDLWHVGIHRMENFWDFIDIKIKQHLGMHPCLIPL